MQLFAEFGQDKTDDTSTKCLRFVGFLWTVVSFWFLFGFCFASVLCLFYYYQLSVDLAGSTLS